MSAHVPRLWEIVPTPFMRYKPRLFPDGNMWCALYGENLQEGVSGFGETPEKAVEAFNKAWVRPLILNTKGERK